MAARLKSSWYGDCLPGRDFPTLVALHRQGRLPLDRFVSETIGLGEVEAAFTRMAAVTCCGAWSCSEPAPGAGRDCYNGCMCYGDEARPPAPPVIGAVGEHRDVVLTSADGTVRRGVRGAPGRRVGSRDRDPARRARAARVLQGTGAALRRGRRPRDRVRLLRAYGRLDRAGRGVPVPRTRRPDGLREGDRGRDAASAAIVATSGATSVFTVGFCLGGSMSWRQSASDAPYAGNIGFYGIQSRAADYFHGCVTRC